MIRIPCSIYLPLRQVGPDWLLIPSLAEPCRRGLTAGRWGEMIQDISRVETILADGGGCPRVSGVSAFDPSITISRDSSR